MDFDKEIKDKIDNLKEFFKGFGFGHYLANFKEYIHNNPYFNDEEPFRNLKGDDQKLVRKFLVKGIIKKF